MNRVLKTITCSCGQEYDVWQHRKRETKCLTIVCDTCKEVHKVHMDRVAGITLFRHEELR